MLAKFGPPLECVLPADSQNGHAHLRGQFPRSKLGVKHAKQSLKRGRFPRKIVLNGVAVGPFLSQEKAITAGRSELGVVSENGK